MNALNIITIILIILGAGIMALAIFRARVLLSEVNKSKYRIYWQILLVMMVFFLIGYLVAAWLEIMELRKFMAAITGVIFFFGALFVLITIHIGFLTIHELINTSVSRNYLNNILNSMINSVVVTDINGTIEIINPAICKLLHYTPEELVGKNVSGIISKSAFDKDPVKLLQKKSVSNMEVDYLNKKGNIVPVLFSGSAIYNEERKLQGLVFVAQDIGKIKKAEFLLQNKAEELSRSNEELEQFAYIASHDLQEPLRMVTSFSKLLSRRYAGKLDKNAKEYLSFITDGVERMNKLIQALLEYSRVSTLAKPVESVDLNSVMEDVKANLQTVMKKENATLIIKNKLPTIYADPTQMLQLFQNLVSNSVKFRKKEISPRIEILSEEKKDYWVFSVKDNGIGIDEKYKEKVFQIFQRVHERDAYPGTGIGLVICKKIVERHGGQIWFESQTGQGTTFYFTLEKSITPT